MVYNVEVASDTLRKISVTVPARDVNAALDAACRQIAAGVSLDGFRKGKVPNSVIEKRFGDEVINNATDNLARQTVSDVLEREDLYPVNQIKVDSKRVARDQDYEFSFNFEVLPEVELPTDLEALSVDVESGNLTQAEIDEVTTRIRRMMATLEEVPEDRLPQDDDVVLIDVNATHDGEAVPSMSSQNFLMHLQALGEGDKESEVEKIVRTLKVGQETEQEITLPEDHPEPSLRGKPVNIKVKLHTINTEALPELSDDMARKMGFEDMGKLRQAIIQQTQSNKLNSVRTRAQQKLVSSLIADLDFPLPESIVNTRMDEMRSEARDQLLKQGLSTEAVADALDNMKDEMADRAKARAKEQVFLMALAQREKMQVQDYEVEQQIRYLAEQSGQDYEPLSERLWQSGVAFTLQDRILMAKAMDLLFNKAKKIAPKEDEALESLGDGAPKNNEQE